MPLLDAELRAAAYSSASAATTKRDSAKPITNCPPRDDRRRDTRNSTANPSVWRDAPIAVASRGTDASQPNDGRRQRGAPLRSRGRQHHAEVARGSSPGVATPAARDRSATAGRVVRAVNARSAGSASRVQRQRRSARRVDEPRVDAVSAHPVRLCLTC